jgi:hypothetical protein
LKGGKKKKKKAVQGDEWGEMKGWRLGERKQKWYFNPPTLPVGRDPSLCKVTTCQLLFKSIIMQDFCWIQ